MAHLDQAKRGYETQAKLRQLAGADRAQLLRRHGFYVRLLEDFGPRPLERSEIEQVGPRAFSRPAAQERIKALLEQGLQKPGDSENRLGFYVGQLGLKDER